VDGLKTVAIMGWDGGVIPNELIQLRLEQKFLDGIVPFRAEFGNLNNCNNSGFLLDLRPAARFDGEKSRLARARIRAPICLRGIQ
jgi:hypothetical protein